MCIIKNSLSSFSDHGFGLVFLTIWSSFSLLIFKMKNNIKNFRFVMEWNIWDPKNVYIGI